MSVHRRKLRHDFNAGAVRIYDFKADYVASKSNRGHLVDDLSYTRITGTLMPDLQGSFHSFPTNAAAQTNLGMKVSPAVTNHCVSTGIQGAVVGILGAGGSFPNGWLSTFAAYYTIEITSIGNEHGLPYMEIHFSGTNNSGGDDYQTIDANSNISTNIGEIWTNSVFYKKTGGSWPVDPRLGLVSVTGSDGSSHPLFERNGDMDSLTRLKSTFTIVKENPVTMRMRPVYFKIDDGETVDVTFKVYAPQLERGSHANVPIITASGVAGVSEKTTCFDDISNLQLTDFSLLIDLDYLAHGTSTYPRIFNFSSSSSSMRLGMYVINDTQVRLWCSKHTPAVYGAGFEFAPESKKLLIRVNGTEIKTFINGLLVDTIDILTPFAIGDLTKLAFGCGKYDDQHTVANFKKSIIYATYLTDLECAELTS